MILNYRKCVYLRFQKISLLTFTRSVKSWSIVFFGSDTYSLHSLEKLHEKMKQKVIRELEVVSKNSSCLVYKYAVENNLKTHLWPPELKGKYDLGVVVSFGKLIPKKIIDLFPLGIINVHASLLPRWRGGMPITHALKNGDKETGVSIMKINSKIDTGDIIMKKAIPIGENEVLPSLYNRLQTLGADCLMEVIDGMPNCLESSVPQSEENKSYAKIIGKEASIVKWSEMTAEEVYNLYRSLFGLYTLKTTWRGMNTQLICMSLNKTNDFDKDTPPGAVKYNKQNQCLIVQCKDKTLRLCTVKLKDKLYSAKDFYRGYMASLPPSSCFFGT